MSRVCEICGKKTTTGHNVSHSIRRTKRTFKPNLLIKRIFNSAKGVFVKTKLCAKCLRSMNRVKA